MWNRYNHIANYMFYLHLTHSIRGSAARYLETDSYKYSHSSGLYTDSSEASDPSGPGANHEIYYRVLHTFEDLPD